MIATITLNLIYGLIWVILAPLRLLPDVSMSGEVASSIASVGSYIAPFNFVLPIATIITIILLVVSIEVGIFLYKGIMWLIKKIPTIN